MSGGFDYTPDLYTLEDEDGGVRTFELLDMMEADGEEYYAFTPYYGDDPQAALQDSGEVVILKKQLDENGEELMVSVDDDEEFDRIGGLFMERIEDMFEFDDEEAGEDDQ